jgi:RNA polymerase sigma factor (TIGR02999 family)
MEITDLLRRVHNGDAGALETLVPLVYDELKVLASKHLQREYSPEAVQTTALVHEAFLRLAGTPLPECQNRSHFFSIAARVMRRVLVDWRAREARRNVRLATSLRWPIFPISALRKTISSWPWMKRLTGSPPKAR